MRDERDAWACQWQRALILSIFEVDVQNRHGEVKGTIPILIIDMDDANILVADIDFGRITLLWSGFHGNPVIGEGAAQEALKLGKFCFVHEVDSTKNEVMD